MAIEKRRFTFLRWFGLRREAEPIEAKPARQQADIEGRKADALVQDEFEARQQEEIGNVRRAHDEAEQSLVDNLKAASAATGVGASPTFEGSDEEAEAAELQEKADKVAQSRLEQKAEMLADSAEDSSGEEEDEAASGEAGAARTMSEGQVSRRMGDAAEFPGDREDAAVRKAEAQIAGDSDEATATDDLRARTLDIHEDRLGDQVEIVADDPEPEVPTITREAITRQAGDAVRRIDDIEEVNVRTADIESLRVAAESTGDLGMSPGELAAQAGIEEPVGAAGSGEDDLGLGGDGEGIPTPQAPDAGALLGGLVTGTPSRADFDAEASMGNVDPRLASDGGDFAGASLWYDRLGSDGTQSGYGQEHYDDDRYSMDITTTHEDGTTTQDVTRRDRLTGEVIRETSTDDGEAWDGTVPDDWDYGNKFDTLEDAFGGGTDDSSSGGGDTSGGGGGDTTSGSGGDTSGTGSGGDTSGGGGGDTTSGSGGDTSGSGGDTSGTGSGDDTTGGDDTSGGEDDDDDTDPTGITSGTDATPNPDDGGTYGPADEAFREFTEAHVSTSPRVERILGAESLQQPPDGDSTVEYGREPRQIDPEAAMQAQLDPLIQYAEDQEIGRPSIDPEDLQFENTLVDPELGITGIVGPGLDDAMPGGAGTDPVADEGLDADLDP